MNEALGTPIDTSSGSHQVLRKDSFNETQGIPDIALEVNENDNQELLNEHFNKYNSHRNKPSPRFDILKYRC